MAHQYCNHMDASFIYLWYGHNNVIYSSYDTYNTCVLYNTYGSYHQMGANCTYGACGTCGTFGAYGTCVTFADEKCGTFVANVTCGTYVTHVPYLQMVHISMDLPNKYKHVFTSGSQKKKGSFQMIKILLDHVHMNRHSFAYKLRCIPH
jgi:hypothetical protein